MIGAAVLLGLAGQAAAPPVAAPPVAAPPAGWREAMVRRDTARRIAADLPAEPRHFRFQCSAAQVLRRPYRWVPPKCIIARERPVTDPERFAKLARAEAAAPEVTADDRLRRTAWLRVMLLHAPVEPVSEQFKTFFVDEAVAATDLLPAPPSRGEALRSDIAFTVRPRLIEYPRQALRSLAEGQVNLRCTANGEGRLHCESMTPYLPDPLVRPDGGLGPQDRFHLVSAAMRSALSAVVGPRTYDGRVSTGLSFTFSVDFRINQ
ncbi:hypothetical protein J2Y54_001112 [Sphingomonas sp. BE123]|uniref:hypothetical protein n=1 Tax=Sphingomonas sp. BE123 TaxID=2817842 RepID=UPI00285BE582|nr:hypothetical protein [Sphingomonas sp. BE123]MDR6851619.1 hypothetical protein [Sphingomonas sp. BE123]